MKKIRITLIITFCIVATFLLALSIVNGAFYYLLKENPLNERLNINCNEEVQSITYKKLEKLTKNLRKMGVKTTLNKKDYHKSGNINLYVTDNSYNLPKIINSNVINVLWIPYIDPQDDFNEFRNFDVIIVKSVPSFSHLKAINVRTAYIPDAFDAVKNNDTINKSALYWGDNDKFSLALNLVGNKKIDIFGDKWKHTIYYNKVIKEKNIKLNDFKNYAIVLVDQDDDDIKKELINDKIIKLIENGFVPFVRYNPGIHAIFNDNLPQYYNNDDFNNKYNDLTSNKTKIKNIKKKLFDIAKNWNSEAQANKFIEIFSIMQKKRIR